MADKLPSGFLSKPDALEKFQKPERTFQRRLAKALRARDDKFLSHFYLATSNGDVRRGTDVAEGEAEQLKGKGLYPVWHIEEVWFANEYDNKTSEKSSGNASKPDSATPQLAPSKDRSSFDREALVAEIESLHRELSGERGHNKLITDQLAIKDEQIRAANKIAIESNQREKEYSSLLKELTGVMRAQLEQGSGSDAVGMKQGKPNTPAITETRETGEEESVIEVLVADNKPASKAKKGTAAKGKKQSRTSRKPASKKKARKPQWYEMPTLKRFLSR